MAQSNRMWPVKTESKKRSQVTNQMQVQTSRPNRYTKPPVRLDLLSTLSVNLVDIWIYSVFTVFTSMHKCPHNGVQAAKRCICMFMHLNIK